MRLSRIILMLLTVAVTSCYFFPFVLAAFPVANSKMIAAAVGIAIFVVRIYKRRGDNEIDRSFVQLSLWALAVSLMAWVATVVNNTPDYTFATYIVSMWVWIGGGYTVVSCIRGVHGRLSVELTVNYLLAVCVGQCILAMIFDAIPAASLWQQHMFAGEAYMGATDEHRLSGIGCALDVAGLRFSAVLVMSAFMAVRAARNGRMWLLWGYLLAMLFVTVVGNMISRTTAVGTGLAVLAMAGAMFTPGIGDGRRRLVGSFALMATAVVVATVALYHGNDRFRDNLRFGFEGFFSLAETGEWHTNSNEILKTMVVWPDNVKTWVIGDGYIENPSDSRNQYFDPYYVGPSFGGYYMQTDIGYCRYIFYFGLVGLTLFCIYFWRVAATLAARFPQYRWMFYMVLALNFIGWCKVSTDLFVVFAPFLSISGREEESAEAVEAAEEGEPESNPGHILTV